MAKRKTSWLTARMPTRADMERSRWLAPIAHRFGHSELWRFTRRSVPRGVALGLFAGFIIPLGQIFVAAFLALPFRANMPLAALVTFVTNPFTLPFWFYIANRLGHFVLVDAMLGRLMTVDGSLVGGFGWFLEVAGATAFGFVLLSLGSASLGYLAAKLAWRVLVARRWNKRATRRPALDPAE